VRVFCFKKTITARAATVSGESGNCPIWKFFPLTNYICRNRKERYCQKQFGLALTFDITGVKLGFLDAGVCIWRQNQAIPALQWLPRGSKVRKRLKVYAK
jgi:hypothetical protein